MSKICCIGGAALRIIGVPQRVLRLRDSNIGEIKQDIGGVAHNVAACLKLFPDTEVELITALGNDFRADMIRNECLSRGIMMDHVINVAGESATYLGILDSDRDLLSGISKMGVMDSLTPETVAPLLQTLNQADAVMMDANLPSETISFLLEHLEPKVYFQTVSRNKAVRVRDFLGRCYALKPNSFEASALSGCSCDSIRGTYRAAEWFLNQGVKQIYISLGWDGIVYGDASGCGHIDAEQVQVQDANGAGDYMLAAIIHESIRGSTAEACAMAGNHASALYCSGAMKNYV